MLEKRVGELLRPSPQSRPGMNDLIVAGAVGIVTDYILATRVQIGGNQVFYFISVTNMRHWLEELGRFHTGGIIFPRAC